MLSGLFFSWKGMDCWIELISLSLTRIRVMFIITLFCSTCWAITSKWWPFRLTAPTLCSHWTMFLLPASSGHGRNIWITGISSTWALCSTIPIFSLSSIEHFILQCQSQTLGLGSKIQVFILSILRLSLPPKWHLAMWQIYSEIGNSKKNVKCIAFEDFIPQNHCEVFHLCVLIWNLCINLFEDYTIQIHLICFMKIPMFFAVFCYLSIYFTSNVHVIHLNLLNYHLNSFESIYF